jgi:N-acetyl-anhydromuramyl-L-alanine amidase AmpD
MRIRNFPFAVRIAFYTLPVLVIILLLGTGEQAFVARHSPLALAGPSRNGPVSQAFARAASEFHVPAVLLKAICYMEGRLSNNGGWPSRDNGFGCMHLVKNDHVDMLDRAARELGVSARQLKLDMPTNIRGGAILLRDYALQLSHMHSLPDNLNDWYGAVAAYSNSTTRSTALMYANAVFQIMHQGFSAQADDGETITLPSQPVRPNTASADAVKGSGRLPTGCRLDQHVDYPGAVDCIVPANSFDCNKMTDSNAPCTYEDARRPGDYAIDLIVIHDIEGTAESALNVFQNVQSQASVHYIVDSDGTVYQVIRESDIAYHCGNYWYNQHSIGIEHAGVDATGYRWYNAAEYLASAKLVAYLLKKYNIPLDHEHIVSHGTVPSPTLADEPNHVDPGPYWLWDYYFKLIHEQGIPYPNQPTEPHVFTLHPKSDQRPYGTKGAETSANFNFFNLYSGPSTASARIPQLDGGMSMIDETGNIEPDISYYYLSRVADPAGNGDMMYKIWYGEQMQTQGMAHARLVWLAVPRGAASAGQGTTIALHADNGHTPQIYGRPTTDKQYIIGDAPAGAIFVSSYSVIEDGTNPGNGNTGNGTGNGDTGSGNGNAGSGTGNENTSSGRPGNGNGSTGSGPGNGGAMATEAVLAISGMKSTTTIARPGCRPLK